MTGNKIIVILKGLGKALDLRYVKEGVPVNSLSKRRRWTEK